MAPSRRSSVKMLLICLLALPRADGARADPPPVQVKVVDLAAKPVPAATVALFEATDGANVKGLKLLGSGKAGVDGEVAFPAPEQPAGSLVIVAWLGAAVVQIDVPQPRETPVVVKLAATNVIRFRIVDDQLHALSGVRATAVAAMTTTRFAHDFTIDDLLPLLPGKPVLMFRGLSDDDGWISRGYVQPGEGQTFQMRKAGYQGFDLRLKAPEDDGLTVVMVPGAAIKGRILLPGTGLPLAGLKVSTPAARDQATTDAGGGFELQGLDEVTTFLNLDGSELVLPVKPITLRRGETADVGDVTAELGCLVTGTIKGADGGRLPAASVLARPAVDRSNPSAGWRRYASIENDGTYRLRLPAGQFVLQLKSLDGQAMALRVNTANQATLTADLQAPAEQPEPPPTHEEAPSANGPAVVDYLWGQVVSMPGHIPVPGARVKVYSGGQKVGGAVADAKGNFAVGSLPIQGEAGRQPFLVTAEAPGYTSPMVKADLSSDKAMTIAMTAVQSLKLKIVGPDGAPVAAAAVSVIKFLVYSNANGWPRMVDVTVSERSSASAAVCDVHGMATLMGVPPDAFAEIKVQHPGFADGIYVVALPRHDVVALRLPHEAVIEGRVMLADGRPITGPGLHMKSQAWSGIWMEFPQWRMSELEPDGHFAIKNVPPLEMIGQATYSPNLDLGIGPNEVKKLEDGSTIQYVPPGRGYDVMYLTQKDGRTERWRGYVEGPEAGITFKEGEWVRHDMTLVPMALLEGKITPGQTQAVSYHDPRSVYSDWEVTCAADGTFELPVPTGDVTVHFKGGSATFKSLKPHEKRQVELSPGEAPATAATPHAGEIAVRVVGPDGATVPRPDLTWSVRGASGGTLDPSAASWALPRMDGTVELWLPGAAGAFEFSSPFLDKPALITPGQPGEYVRLRLDRRPPHVPSLPVREPANELLEPSAQSLPFAAPMHIGDTAPEIQASRWVKGGPVTLAGLKGKIVVLAFSNGEALQRLTGKLRDRPVVIVVLLAQGISLSSAATSYSGHPLTWPRDVLAVGQDPMIRRTGNHYNARRFATPYGAAVIDADGKIAAQGLDGEFLQAKVDQLLSLSE